MPCVASASHTLTEGTPKGGRIVQSGFNGLQFDDWMLLNEKEKLSERMLFNKRKRNPDKKLTPGLASICF